MHLRSFPRRQPETIWEIFQMQEVEAKLGGTQEFTGMPSRNQLETVHFQIENTCRENCKWWVFQPALLALFLVSSIRDLASNRTQVDGGFVPTAQTNNLPVKISGEGELFC